MQLGMAFQDQCNMMKLLIDGVELRIVSISFQHDESIRSHCDFTTSF